MLMRRLTRMLHVYDGSDAAVAASSTRHECHSNYKPDASIERGVSQV